MVFEADYDEIKL